MKMPSVFCSAPALARSAALAIGSIFGLMIPPLQSAPFTPGNLVIYRVGAGSSDLLNTGASVFLDEYTSAGVLVQSIEMPTTVSGSNKRLVASGTATSEGLLTRSADGRFLILTGYDVTPPHSVSLSGSASSTVNRVIGRVNAAGTVDTSTALSDYATGNNPRSAISADGTKFWTSGGVGGVRLASLGASTSSDISTTVTSLRQLGIVGGQLYTTTSSGSAVRLGTVGSGLPEATGQVITNLSGIPTSGSPYAFFFADLSSGVAGVDTVYIADDTNTAGTGGVRKFSLVSGTWTANGIAGVHSDAYRGLTGVVSGTTVTLYATRKGGTAAAGGGELVSLTDSTGYNATISATPALLATASARTAFRGIALAPQPEVKLLITEVQSSQASAGKNDFWELTNVGADAVDLSNWKWDDDSRNPADLAAVTIPAGTTIAPGESIVFTGLAAATFRTWWGIAETVRVISTGAAPGLGSNDAVALFDSAGTERAYFSYAAGGFTKSDGGASAGGHAGASAGGSGTVSVIWDPVHGTTAPRYRAAVPGNSGAFASAENASDVGSPGISGFVSGGGGSVLLTIGATPSTFSESASNPASVGSVTRSGSTTGSLEVTLSSSDMTEATVPASVTIPDGQASVSFNITAVNDSFPDGSKTVTITATATGATPGTLDLTVQDDGDVLDTSFLLTEVQSNQSVGKPVAANDFWELTNIGATSKDISGYSWHDSGRSASAAQAYKLPAGTSIAPGESVIFTAAPAADFRAWWGIPASVQVFQSVGAPGLGQNDGVSFFDAQQNELFYFSYGIGGFTREDGTASVGGHAGPSAGGSAESQSLVWVTSSGTATPRYTAASGTNLRTFSAVAPATDLGSPGIGVVRTVSLSDNATAEGNAGTKVLALTVTRSDTATAFTVDYAVTGGSATSGTDYVALASGTLAFTNGGAATQTIDLTLNGDTETELDETVVVTLSNLVNTVSDTVIGRASGTATITNDDIVVPSLTQVLGGSTIASGGVTTLRVAASGHPAPTLQWYRGGKGDTSNPISGATSPTLLTSALSGSTNFWVRASNAGGDFDSDTVTVNVVAPVTSVDLSNYVRVGRYRLPEPLLTALPAGTPTHNLLCQEASGVAYNWDTDTLFVVADGGRSVTQVSKNGVLVDTMTLALGSSPQGTEFYDIEGITYVGGGQFVMSEERDRQLVKFTYAAGTTLTRAQTQTVKIGTFVDNTGTEGLSYDPLTSGFIVLKEISPIGIFQTTVDFAAGTASNGSASTVNSTDLFTPALLGMTDVADVFALSLLPGMTGQPQQPNLIVLSQEDGKLVNIDRGGVISSTRQLFSDPGNPLSVAGQQHEGVTMDAAGFLYIVNENGGGGIDFPELWVYAPATAPNAAPTGLTLNGSVTSVIENTGMTSPLRLGEVVVIDDGLGTNVLSLAGADAAFFELVGNTLFLKSGTILDFETKSSYQVTLGVDDATLGTTPDATQPFTLTVTDQDPETPPPPVLLITEVAPWASSNSAVGADWFEVTNISPNAVDISGWKIDDSSKAFGSAAALNGITSIVPGESVIFIETTDLAGKAALFRSTWFGSNPPSGLQIGSYSGSGLGLSTGGDAVWLFDTAGQVRTGITFGSSPSGPSYPTFDNTAGLNGVAVSRLSVVGIHGALPAAAAATEIGSPGFAAPGLLRITEVAPWSSGSSPVGADWFEVTNVGARVVSLAGWKMDDSSESPVGAVALNGIAAIAPGESVIFLETETVASTTAAFRSNWFGSSPPSGLQVGTYSGSGVGLSSGGDAVVLYDGANVRRAKVTFGASVVTAPFATFDNSALADNAAVTRLSAVGANGAFAAFNNSANEIGSPGLTNRPPSPTLSLSGQSAAVNGSFSFSLPSGTFVDPENASLTYSATLADGSPLPSWLSINAATGALSGTPAAVHLGRIVVRISAADNGVPAQTGGVDLALNVAPAAGSAFFPLSVASGDPRETSVVLWTRLMDGDSSVDRSVSLHLSTAGSLPEVGALTALGGTNLWSGGSLTARAAHDGVVKVKATGLAADTTYYYQFTYNGQRSPIGRTRTAPAPGSNRVVKYAAINCNDFVGRYFNSLKHLADQEAENIDFVLNLGDYIYETTGDASFQTTSAGRAMVLSNPSEAINLGGGNYAAQSIGNYRDLYKTIRQDRQLQRVHELFPMISIWDDHEFSDDNWKDNATFFDGRVNEQQTARKRNGEQAWMEFLPTERGLSTDGRALEIDSSDLYPNTVIYDAFNFGGNLDLITTDIRTGRADHLIPEEVCPSGVPMTEENVIATLAAANGLGVADFTAAVWPGLRGNFAPYVNIDDPALASVKGAFKAIIGTMADAAFASLPAGQTPVSTGAQYADASVKGLRDAAFINQVFAGAGFPAPFSASDLAAMPRGLSYYLLGKTSLFSEFGSRYQVVNQTFQIYAGYTYQAFLLSGGSVGRDQAFFDSAQQSFLGGALASSSTAGRAWRVVASSTPYTPIQFELGDLPSGVTLPTLGSISGVTIPASIPSQFLVEFLLNADEPAGFPQFRKGILDLLAQHDAILVSGDIHAQLVGNNLASNGQRVVDFTVPSAASSEFRRAVSGAFASVESLMTPSVRAATGLSGNFTFNPAQKQAVINATDGIIKKNTAEMFEADTASHGYTVFTATPGAFTANYRKINVGYVDDNLYGETPAALDALFSRRHYVVSKTGTGATTDLSLGVPTTVTPTVAANTGGSVSGGGELVTGSPATFTATAASGHTFRGWTVNGSSAGSANPLNVTVTAGMTVEARFSYGLQLLHLADGEAGLLAPQTAPNLAALVDHFDGTYANTLILAGGDNFIPSPFLYGGTDPSVRPVLNAVTGSTISLSSSTNHPIAAVDIAIHNVIGVEASTIGNHEFDLGSRVFRDAFTPGSVTGWVGAAFPYLSANLNFSGDLDLTPRFTDVTLNGTTTLVPAASAGNGRIVPVAVITKGGEKIGLLGATTQLLQGISSPTGTTVKGGGGADNMDQLAGVLQPYINELIAEGVNKIVLMAHLQQIANEQLLATKLSGVDVILAGGSNTRLGDADDVAAVFPGHAASFANPYPISTAGADGKPVLIVNTDNEYTYVGRLVIDFDANGEVITSDLAGRVAINGAYAATAARVASVWGVSEANLATTAFAAGTKGARVKALTDAVQSVIVSKDGDVKGFTNVYLEGERALIRNQETNLGNLTADANAAALLAMAPTGAPVVSFKNGGGIRAQIGATEVGSGAKIPPVANPGAGKPSGAVSVLDIENSLRFNNRLMVFDTTPAGLKAILEHGVASLGTQGRFPQIGGVSFAYDPARPAGDRITRIALTGGAGQLRDAVYDGTFSPWAPPVIRLVTLNFLAGNTASATGLGTGGDGYPIRANGGNFRFLLDNGTLSAPVDPTLNFTAADVVPANALGEQTALGNYFAANHATAATAYNGADTPESSDLRIQNLSRRSNAVPYDLSLLLGGDGTGGLGGVSVGAGGRQGIRLSLGSRRVVVIGSSGGAGLGAEVLDAGGAVVGSYSGSGEIALNLELGAGDYLIRVSNAGSTARVLGLTVDASGVPAPKPDLAVGRTLGTLVGVEAYGAASTQQRVETTRTLAPVRSVVAAWNRGGGSEVLVLRATKDASDFRTTYVSGGTNITAELLLGRYETAQLTSTDGPVVIQSTVVPSQTLRQRQVVTTSGGPGRRPIPRTIVTILDRTNLVEIRASAKSNATLGDAVQIRVLTR